MSVVLSKTPLYARVETTAGVGSVEVGTSTVVVGASVVDRGSSGFAGSDVDTMGVSILGASLGTFEVSFFSGDFDRVRFLNPEVSRRPRDPFREVSAGLVSEAAAWVSSAASPATSSVVSGADAEDSAAGSPFVMGVAEEDLSPFFPRSTSNTLARLDFSGLLSGEAGAASSVAGAVSEADVVASVAEVSAGAVSPVVSLAGSGEASFATLLFANRPNAVRDLRFSFLLSGAGVSED